MNTTAILFLIVITIPIIVWLWLRRRERMRTESSTRAVLSTAAAHHLQAEESADKHVLRRVIGQHNGVKWALEIRQPMAARISNPPPFLLWTAEKLRSAGETVLVARSAALPPTIRSSGVLASFALHDVTLPSVLGPTLGMLEENYRRLVNVNAGSEKLKEQYLILASSDEAARGFLTPAREQALLTWAAAQDPKEQPTYIVQWRHALHVMVDGEVDSSTVERVVTLGEGLV